MDAVALELGCAWAGSLERDLGRSAVEWGRMVPPVLGRRDPSTQSGEMHQNREGLPKQG